MIKTKGGIIQGMKEKENVRVDGTIQTKSIEIISDDESHIIGKNSIEKEKETVFVPTKAVQKNSYISLTITSKTDETIYVDEIQERDTSFNWFILEKALDD